MLYRQNEMKSTNCSEFFRIGQWEINRGLAIFKNVNFSIELCSEVSVSNLQIGLA